MERRFNDVTDRRGNAVASATVTVKTLAGATATIFSDDGVTTATNPLTTNFDGEYTYFAANGSYTEQIVAEGYGSDTLTNVVLYDPSDVSMGVDDITTVTYTLALTDIGQWRDVFTSATATLTISTASGYAIADTTVIRQKGSGGVTLSAGSRCKLEVDGTASTRAQKAVIAITRVKDEGSGTAVFSVYGNTTT